MADDVSREFLVAMGGNIIRVVFWLVVPATFLWLVRRFAPRAESWLFAPISQVIRRLANLAWYSRLGVRRIDSQESERRG